MQEIAIRIKETRIKRGLTQEQLAEKLGYNNRSSINKIEKNTYEIGLETLIRIAKALNVSPAYLAFGDDPIKDDVSLLFDKLNPDQQESVLLILRSMTGETGET